MTSQCPKSASFFALAVGIAAQSQSRGLFEEVESHNPLRYQILGSRLCCPAYGYSPPDDAIVADLEREGGIEGQFHIAPRGVRVAKRELAEEAAVMGGFRHVSYRAALHVRGMTPWTEL
ncbi:hypothetical protein E4U54_003098 [Claviceps lovelessii]|nr:hypothetical protein E4U54_003098 [Claviceps lovelessii]